MPKTKWLHNAESSQVAGERRAPADFPHDAASPVAHWQASDVTRAGVRLFKRGCTVSHNNDHDD